MSGFLRNISFDYKSTLNLFVFIVAVWSYVFLVNRFSSFSHWDQLIKLFYRDASWALWISLLGLAILNISIESLKWKSLLNPIVAISFRESLVQILVGMLTAVGIPGRLAEPGGRMLYMRVKFHKRAILLTYVGGAFQNLIILIGGIVGLLSVKNIWSFNEFASFQHLVTGGLFVFLLLGVFFYIILRKNVFKPVLFLRKILKSFFKQRAQYYFKITLYTFLRYLVYNVQLYIVFLLIGVDIGFPEFLPYSCIYYFMISLVPSFLLTDVGIRGLVSVFVFRVWALEDVYLIGAVFLLWIINQALPIMLGGILHLSLKPQRFCLN